MVSLLAVSALTMTSNSSAMDAAVVVVDGVDAAVVANATFWVDFASRPGAKADGVAVALRAAGFDDRGGKEALRQSLEFVRNFLARPELEGQDRNAKITALARFLNKAPKSFLRKNAANMLVAVIVAGVVAADYGLLGERFCIGEPGKLDAHKVLWAKIPSVEEAKAYAYSWYAWVRGTAAPADEVVIGDQSNLAAPTPAPTPAPEVVGEVVNGGAVAPTIDLGSALPVGEQFEVAFPAGLFRAPGAAETLSFADIVAKGGCYVSEAQLDAIQKAAKSNSFTVVATKMASSAHGFWVTFLAQ